MVDFLKSRSYLINEIKKEIIGPEPCGDPINLNIDFPKQDDKPYGPFYNEKDNQEILILESPLQKYGSAIIFPKQNHPQVEDDENAAISGLRSNQLDENDLVLNNNFKGLESRSRIDGEDTETEFDLSGSNTYKPSSMGLSFFAKIPKNCDLIIETSKDSPMGIYSRFLPQYEENTSKCWWVREDFHFKVVLKRDLFPENGERKFIDFKKNIIELSNPNVDLRISALIRADVRQNTYLVTISASNDLISQTERPRVEDCIFQANFNCKFSNNEGFFISYPKGKVENKIDLIDEEENNLNLLYRKYQTFAIGHGCSVSWKQNSDRVMIIHAHHFPLYESPNITPDFNDLKFPMKILAGITKEDEIFNVLERLAVSYNEWIKKESLKVSDIDDNQLHSFKKNIKSCNKCHSKIIEGINFLKENSMALKAFKLSNEAILYQQLRGSIKKREFRDIELPFEAPDPLKHDLDLGNWRPFQLGFILSCIKSSVEKTIKEREDVELIFFPTGGGKTEAYLGLSAFTCFYRRMIDKEDIGVQVLMRYTLRLLTQQQFSRASGLIASMEVIRRKNIDLLGSDNFSIGVWVGGSTTPNKNEGSSINKGAIQEIKSLNAGGEIYKFLITSCPWCGMRIGPNKSKNRDEPKLMGLKQKNNEVQFRCEDKNCDFHNVNLPIYVVDEDIYRYRPSILIGTVDKFAQIAWQENSKKIFGLNEEGVRVNSPPSLIIQDELHLITGPLGTMCGLYEGLIEDLCSDKRNSKNYKPKIICSTATIRSYKKQIKDLFNREEVNLFPPFLKDIDDSFFAKFLKSPENTFIKPKIYLGLMAPNYSSTQTFQVRIYSRLLYSVFNLDESERDPWFTLMNFFGSLRELGNTISLIRIDIPDQLKLLTKRYNLDSKSRRSVFLNTLELTSREKNEKIAESIDKLKVNSGDKENKPIDICLASNIIEVGVDIPRLSLLTILGQPKTTSSYIQVSGRIGRNFKERPGLVLTLYGHTRPRDRSHFEKFQSYHQKLYAQVEPMSVTPFSPPVLDKALHAVMVSYVRMYGNREINRCPYPYPEKLINNFEDLILKRLMSIDPNEKQYLLNLLKEKKHYWKVWKYETWTKGSNSESDIGLLHRAGNYLAMENRNNTWITPTSLRDVDAECKIEITKSYMSKEMELQNE
ncbi:helicase-related protein [Alphaproteobacteria bacterium]|nr:helicase-related protein [Alphaproteobacteria bacterium]